jgi:uncharacterized RDD family membrane protein YckC
VVVFLELARDHRAVLLRLFGMRAWQIRVVRDDGGALTWPRAATRFALGLVAAAPAGLGLWWALLETGKRGWHDRWTGTRVVRAATSGKR